MESPARPTSSDKAALWRARKGEIRVLVALGLELNQIEDELQKDGSRVNTQVRENIIWEKRYSEVRDLLAQGLDVTGEDAPEWMDLDRQYPKESFVGVSSRRNHQTIQKTAKRGCRPRNHGQEGIHTAVSHWAIIMVQKC